MEIFLCFLKRFSELRFALLFLNTLFRDLEILIFFNTLDIFVLFAVSFITRVCNGICYLKLVFQFLYFKIARNCSPHLERISSRAIKRPNQLINSLFCLRREILISDVTVNPPPSRKCYNLIDYLFERVSSLRTECNSLVLCIFDLADFEIYLDSASSSNVLTELRGNGVCF